jgi:hypothetical protein
VSTPELPNERAHHYRLHRHTPLKSDVPVSPSSPPAGITLGKHPAIRVPEVPIKDARGREQTAVGYGE